MRYAILLVLLVAACESPTAPPMEFDDTLTGAWVGVADADSVFLTIRESDGGAVEGCLFLDLAVIVASPISGVRSGDALTLTGGYDGWAFAGTATVSEIQGTATSDELYGGTVAVSFERAQHDHPCYY